MPAVAAAPSGAVIAAWRSSGAIVSAARPPGGGAFGGFQPISGPAMNTSLPKVVAGGNGDALISWSLGDGKAIPTVQRKASGAFGPLLTAVSAANPAPGENLSFFEPSIGIDDEGNGASAWTRTSNRAAIDHFRFQTASFDAAPPVLSATVPPGGTAGAQVGMAAAAADRVSPATIAWAFGDGGTATGGAVSHAFGKRGAFTVTITATDGAGNAATQTHPILVAPKKKRRVRSQVSITWGVTSTRTYLLKLKVLKVPKGGKAELRCKGTKCPFKRMKSKKRRRGTITLFKEIKPSKVAGKQQRTFRPGQRVELRITKKGYIGKVVRYKLKAGKVPSGKNRCLPVGATKPRKRCP
jgi:chitodextrinase